MPNNPTIFDPLSQSSATGTASTAAPQSRTNDPLLDPSFAAAPPLPKNTVGTATKRDTSETTATTTSKASGKNGGVATATDNSLPRTIQWRINLHLLPPPSSAASSSIQFRRDRRDILKSQRDRYDALLRKNLWECSPLALIEENSAPPPPDDNAPLQKCQKGFDPLSAMLMEDEAVKRKERKERMVNESKKKNKEWENALVANGLLQLVNRTEEDETEETSRGDNATSKWSLFHMSRETLALIEKDLNRLPPSHFTVTTDPVIPAVTSRRNDRTQLLSQILFVYAKEYPALGYRQGMHEIASCILLALEIDIYASHRSGGSGAEWEWWDARWIGHDAFTIFEVVMYHLSPAYDPMADEIVAPATVSKSDRPVGLDMSSIVRGVFGKVRDADGALADFLTEVVSVPPQLYCTRWIRLMFAREISGVNLALVLWDAMFAFFECGVGFMDILEYVAASMIILVRKRLLGENGKGDENEAIHVLMNYPQLEHVGDLLEKVNLLMWRRKKTLLDAPSSTQNLQAQTQPQDKSTKIANKHSSQPSSSPAPSTSTPLSNPTPQPKPSTQPNRGNNTNKSNNRMAPMQPISEDNANAAAVKPGGIFGNRRGSGGNANNNAAPTFAPGTDFNNNNNPRVRNRPGVAIQQSVKQVTSNWQTKLMNFGDNIADALHHPRSQREERLDRSIKVMQEFLKSLMEKGQPVPDEVWEAVAVFENVKKAVADDGRNGAIDN